MLKTKNIEDIYPLSPTQEGMLFHSLYAAESGDYVSQFLCTLKIPELATFERVLQTVVDRQPVLRTAIAWKAARQPVQVVGRQVRLPIEHFDWRDLDDGEFEERLLTHLREDRTRGFQFTRAPLMRVALIRRRNGLFDFLWSYHHLLLDGWSTPLVMKEVFALYAAQLRGEEPRLPKARPYRDFIAWLKRQDSARAEAYWRQVLREITEPTPLPAGGGPAGNPGGTFEPRLEIELPPSTVEALDAWARRGRLTRNTLVQAAWALLLSRYGRCRRVLFGVTVSGRPGDLPGVESMVGLFINTLPLRLEVPSDQPLSRWLAELQLRQAELGQYEYSSLAQLRQWSEVPAELPLFESIVVFENYPVDRAMQELATLDGGLQVEGVRALTQTNYPLTFVALPRRGLTLQLLFDPERFAPPTIERMLRHLRNLLAAMVADPEARLDDLPLLTAPERQQLLEWNDSGSTLPAYTSAAQILTAQAAHNPDGLALVCGEDAMSYRELDRRTHRLAHLLRHLGVGPETIVGLYIHRSLEMIVGLFGILKAGGAYLPLDPTEPAERLDFLLTDSRVSIVVSEEALAAGLPATVSEVICLDGERFANHAASEEDVGGVVGGIVVGGGDHLAYIIYTSGSTGVPKGVGVSHRNLLNYLSTVDGIVVDGAAFELPLSTRLIFDASLRQIFCPLLSGRAIWVLPEEVATHPDALLQALHQRRAAVLSCVPSLWRALLDEIELTDAIPPRGRLRRLILGGEEVTKDLLLRTRAHLPDLEVWNFYGPTETSVNATLGRLDRGDAIHIGRPVANTRAHLLDDRLRPLPLGVGGELLVGGVAVARGYLHRPALTAERFVPDPSGIRPGTRLYKTGDLVRLSPQGTIQFLGRIDQQVKVRGFRIEPGEIARRVAEEPGVAEAVVRALGESSFERRLVAYVVPHPDGAPTEARLRSSLAAKLPQYMIPQAFVLLEELPRTATGKLNARALPTPEEAGKPAAEREAPKTQVEEIVAQIWGEVLGIEGVTRQDNFFELGGHSLLATQVASRILRTLQVEFPLRALFEAPTLVELAAAIEDLMQADQPTATPAIEPRGHRRPPALSFAQQRLWFLNQLEPESPAYNLSAAYRLEGRFALDILRRALTEIVRRHEVLRTAFRSLRGQAIQVILPPPKTVPVLVVDYRGLPSARRETACRRLATEQARRSFDLSRPPLFRTILVRWAEEEHVAFFVMHHIVSDGWSMRVFIRELRTLYESFVIAEPASLPELPVQYADYGEWQRGWLQGEALEAQLSYWTRQLEGSEAVLELPSDRPRPAVRSSEGATRSLVLGTSLGEELRALGVRHGVTLFMTCLAGFQALLCRHTGRDRVNLGTPIANRTRSVIEPLIGCFANTLVLRTDLSGNPSFKELLGRVREVTLGAYAHQDLPLERLTEELQPERSLSHSPLFQVMLVLQNLPHEDVVLPGLRLTSYRAPTHTTKFDMTLDLNDAGGGLSSFLEYSTDLFDGSTIRRLLGHLRTLLTAVVKDPNRRLAELPLLTRAETSQLLVEWNAAPAMADDPHLGPGVEPGSEHIHGFFAHRAEEQPAAIALAFAGHQVSYLAVDRRSTAWAHRLRRLGVAPEIVVGIALDRSPEMILCMLAILKAGGAYLPLDPTYPKERLAFLIEDAKIPVLLTTGDMIEQLPIHGAQTLLLEQLNAEELNAEGDAGGAPPPAAVGGGAENPAYVIYTSGSTGQPKGVLVSHHNVLRLLTATHPWYGFGPRDVWTFYHSFAFDFSVWEIWGALLYGGRLIGVPYWVSRSPDRFHRLLRDERVTVLNQTPSAFRQLIALDEAQYPVPTLALRHVIFGGEALEPRSLVPWVARRGFLRPRLTNMYGITETTVHVTLRTLGAADLPALDADSGEVPEGAGLSPLGVPIPDLEIHLLDRHQRPVPLGVHGEICVGGPGLSRGYLNRPALTAERFVAAPHSDRPGARLYRSGDLGRRLPSGELDYLGRIDHQVKVRGFRIELGEIEAALVRHPALRQVVTMARADQNGGAQRLVAYFVASGAQQPSTDELRTFLEDALPAYMLPASFVALSKFPLTRNGKIDRAALPAPEAARPDLDAPFVAPRNLAEQVLAGVWHEVLGVENVGIHDNFFALGGDSIRSVQVLARSRERGLDWSLQELFQYQTIRELAARAKLAPALAPPPVEAFGLLKEGERERLPEDLEDAYPLSMLQVGMLFHSDFNSQSLAYHNVTSSILRAPFDAAALRRALDRLAARHPILRTSFDTTSFDMPLQRVHRRVEIPLLVVDCAGLPPGVQRRALQTHFEEEKKHKFHWHRSPLLRFQVHLLGRDYFQLTHVEHHAIVDGWSVATMLVDLFTFYRAELSGKPWIPPPLRAHFREYIAMELAALEAPEPRAFWVEKLGDRPFARIPRHGPGARGRGRKPPPEQKPSSKGRGRIAQLGIPIPRHLSKALERCASIASVPFKSVLLAAHVRVLQLVCGGTDVVTGLVIHGRPEATDSEKAVGLFLNTLPLRFTGHARTWADLAQQVFLSEQEMMPFRHYPLAAMQKELGRSLFEVAFSYLHFHVLEETARSVGFDAEPPKAFTETNFAMDVTFHRNEGATGDLLNFQYDAAEFSRRQVQKMAGYFLRAFQAMVRGPEEFPGPLALLSAAEVHQLLVEWNDTGQPTPQTAGFTERFAAQTRRRPESIAVLADRAQLSYFELERRAHRLAHALQARGVGTGTLVALYGERSPEMVIALLGVLAAGAGYVPLDPTDPTERLAFALDDTRAVAVLTRERWAPGLPETAPPTLLLEDVWREVGRAEHAAPESPVQLESAAYVIYTSGSTGRPKGVVISHRDLAEYAAKIVAYFDLVPEDRFLQFASLAFDVSVEEIFPTLLAGATLVVPRRDLLASPNELSRLIARQRLTALELPTVYWHQWVEELARAPRRGLSTLRFLIMGGEKTSPEHLVTWRSFGIPLFHVFGLTEVTVSSMFYPLTSRRGGGEVPSELPIGRPIAGHRIYLLDESGGPVPPGVPGELYLGGSALARGYLRRPALTAQRFLPDPEATSPGARRYRTGDLARYQTNGNLVFLDRLDHQVKVRGFRVELGEIEAALLRHPAVQEAVVTARSGASGTRLVAYWVGRPGSPLTRAELRRHLQAGLPEPMVPTRFVELEVFPLNRNGKVDRRALPEPEVRPEAGAYRPPQTEVEQRLAKIWEEALGVEQVGVDDNFFELGGDSILSIQIVSRALRTGLKVTPQQLFETPTLAELATRVDEAPQPAQSTGGARGEVLLSPIQHWFFDTQPADPHHFNMPLLLELRRQMTPSALLRTLQLVFAHHDALRLRFTAEGPEWRQFYAPPGTEVPCHRIDLSSLPEAGHRRAVEGGAAQLQRSLDLAVGPVARAAIWEFDRDRPARLFLLIHHLVMDAVSWRILLEDLEDAWQQQRRGEAIELQATTTSFQEWSARLSEAVDTEDLLSETDYWLAPKRARVSPLPVDHPGVNLKRSMQSVRQTLDAESTRALLKDVPAVYHTQINDLLLAALARTLERFIGRRLVLIDLEGHGREEIAEDLDLSRTVGWMTTIFPVLLDLEAAATEATLIKEVKEQLRAVPRRGLGYGLLRYLNPSSEVADRLGALPQADVLFNYLGQLDRSLSPKADFVAARETIGPSQSPRQRRSHLLEVNSSINRDRLEMRWTYSDNIHQRSTIERLAEDFLSQLRALIDHCLSPEAGGYTPSDFPLAAISSPALDALLEGLASGEILEDLYPLAPLQHGMLFHSLYEPEAGMYIAQFSFELPGEFDVQAFEKAWQRLADDHPVLRTAFRWEGLAEPLQLVYRKAPLPFVREDWRDLGAATRKERFETHLVADRKRGFDLSRAPLVRGLLLRESDSTHRFLWTFHQMLFDGWSLPLLMQHFFAAYEAFAAGGEPALSAGPTYRTYIA